MNSDEAQRLTASIEALNETLTTVLNTFGPMARMWLRSRQAVAEAMGRKKGT